MEINIKIADLFKAVQHMQGISLELDKLTPISPCIEVLSENNNWIDVNSLVIKKDEIIKLTLSSGKEIEAGAKHLISTSPSNLIKMEELQEGDHILDSSGIEHTVVKKSAYPEDYVYDINVESDPHLYQCAQGFVHHNSHTVEDALIKELKGTGKSFLIKKGAATGRALFTILHDNRESLIVFDDCDSIFKDENGVNVLKAALDTKKNRWISWNAQGMGDEIESDFIFSGEIIFISNKSPEYINQKTDGALKSRSTNINFDLTPDEMLGRIERILDKISPGTPMEIKREVLEYLKKSAAETNREITLRAMEIGIAMKQEMPDQFETLAKYIN